MKVLFVIHGPKNDCTAIYITYKTRTEYCGKIGWQGQVISPDDFHLSSKLLRMAF